MENQVRFDEEREELIPIPRPKPVTMASMLLHSGIASRPGDAMIILAIVAFCLIAGSFYFLASAVPPPPNLGNDVLRPGEVPAAYVR